MAFNARWKSPLSIAVIASLVGLSPYAQNSKSNSTDAAQSEYEVFSAYIAEYFVGKATKEGTGPPASQIIIVDTTAYDTSEIEEDMPWKDIEKLLRKQVPSLEPETIKNFREVNMRQAALQQRFDFALPYQLVPGNTIYPIFHSPTDWSEYYRQYPGAQGFLTLSRVGFSPDGRQAIFYASNYCGGKCATGSFTVAKRRGKRWTIVKEVILWAS